MCDGISAAVGALGSQRLGQLLSGLCSRLHWPSDALYGTFGGNDDVSATTDANGVAAASGFVAGSTAGSYNVFAFAPNQEVGGTDYTNTGGSFAYFSIFQVGGLPGGGGGQPAGAPTLSTPTLTLLAAILMLAAFANRRKAGEKN